MSDYIPDPDKPEKVAIRPDGGLAFGIFVTPPMEPGYAPTLAELERGMFIGWADAEQFGNKPPAV